MTSPLAIPGGITEPRLIALIPVSHCRTEPIVRASANHTIGQRAVPDI